MKDNGNYSILEARKLLDEKKISSVELTSHFLKKIKESKLNSYITVCDESALLAGLADGLISKGEIKPLTGIPTSIKDAFCTKGVRTTMASKMLENFIPEYESTVTERLKKNGIIMLGKTNMDEFAMGSRNKNSYFGQAFNPWKIKGDDSPLVPGGSSGGSAGAIAGNLCVASTGTDTGGSVRQPAAFCGIVGFKPSYGLCSRYGMIAYASSLDQAGFMTKTVKDSALMFELTAGADGKDATLLDFNPKGTLAGITGDIKGLKIGLVKEFMGDDTHPEILANVHEAREMLEKLGAEIIDISLPNAQHSIKLYYFISTIEAASNLARFDGVKYGYSNKLESLPSGISYADFISKNRGEGFGAEVKSRILTGVGTLMAGNYEDTYKKAMQLRALICAEYDKAFEKVDVILNQTTPNLALKISETQTQIQEYLNDILTVPINIAGLPSISVPTVLSKDGRPIGLQLTAKRFDDAKLLNVAFSLESAFNFFNTNY
jgi:aspartyl-tRNA(Asn)/glutamyl-tRNA(Gln) amidotransferase subunit A